MFKDQSVIVHYTLLSLLGISYSCSIVLTSVNQPNFTDETAETFPEKQTSLRPLFCKALKITRITHVLEIRNEINLQCSLIYSVVQLQSAIAILKVTLAQ